jgi:hypothetical protein
MAVGVSPNDASFWSYHACALYLNGTRSNVGCGMNTECYGHVVSSFRRSMESGAVSVDVGGWIQEMVSSGLGFTLLGVDVAGWMQEMVTMC